MAKKEQVAQMFNNIAPKYDFLNTLLSFGIHGIWRKKAIKLLQPNAPKLILDIATGTGDFAIEAIKLNPDKIIGVDISAGMLRLGNEKITRLGLGNKIILQQGDSENLPFDDGYFDAVTVAFGVRNFEHLDLGLSSILRVLKPGGTLVVLEFSKPNLPVIKQLYQLYSRFIMPTIGKFFSKDSYAYSYLPASVSKFPDGIHFVDILKKNGFIHTNHYPLTFSIATIYIGKK